MQSCVVVFSGLLRRIWGHRFTFALLILILAGLAIRLYRIDVPVIDMKGLDNAAITRYLHERGYQILRPQTVYKGPDTVYLAEFPLYNLIVALSYEISGVNEINGRILSMLFWVISAYLLYKLASRFSDSIVGLFTMYVFLLLPLGVTISRSFQAESFLAFLSIGTVYSLYLWAEEQRKLFFAGGLICLSLSVLIKGHYLVLLAFPTLTLLVIGAQHPGNTLRPLLVLSSATLALLPGVLWYTYGFLQGNWGSYASVSILPHLLLTRDYYSGVKELFVYAVSLPGVPFMVLGVYLKTEHKGVVALHAWLLGVIAYMMIFTYQAMTHHYYHIVWLPVASVFIGIALGVLWRSELFRNSYVPWLSRMLLVTFMAYFWYFSFRYTYINKGIYSDRTDLVRGHQAIGKLLGQGDDLVLVHSPEDYGLGVLYYAHRNGYFFPSTLDWDMRTKYQGASRPNMINLFESFRKKRVKYFVSTASDELMADGLLQHLQTNYKLVSDPNANFVVYDVR